SPDLDLCPRRRGSAASVEQSRMDENRQSSGFVTRHCRAIALGGGGTGAADISRRSPGRDCRRAPWYERVRLRSVLFAEIALERTPAVSHRGRALGRMRDWLLETSLRVKGRAWMGLAATALGGSINKC